jgi:hypothetical protein
MALTPMPLARASGRLAMTTHHDGHERGAEARGGEGRVERHARRRRSCVGFTAMMYAIARNVVKPPMTSVADCAPPLLDLEERFY